MTSEPLADLANRVEALTALDRTLLVEAGAGAGKTSLMAGRVAMLLANGRSPASIAAITFTRAAAAELRKRIEGLVADLRDGVVPKELAAALPDGLGEAQRTALAAAVPHLHEITCATIHSFCHELILAFPVEADIDPGATVLEGAEYDVAVEATLREWVSERVETAAGSSVARLLVAQPTRGLGAVEVLARLMLSRSDVRAPEVLALRFDEQIAAMRSTLAAFNAEAATQAQMPPSVAATRDGFAALLEMAAPLTQATPEAALAVIAGFPSSLMTSQWQLRAATTITSASKWKACGFKQAEAAAISSRVAERYKDAVSALEAALPTLVDLSLAALLQELRLYVDHFARWKRGRAFIDHHDELVTALRLLSDSREARQMLGRRYAHILVDEFQDTNPLQIAILRRLAGDGDGEDAPLRPGQLFLVGDPKQAIYRFLGADIDSYVGMRNTLRDAVVEISANFRSAPSILDFVNQNFEEPFKADGQPGFFKLSATRQADGRPHVLSLPVATTQEKGSGWREAEAEAVASFCRTLVDQHGYAPGDIVLLTPTFSGLWLYENALARQGLRVSAQASKGFYKRQEVHDMVALARVLADPSDTIALGALLRGPLVGLTEDQLLAAFADQPPVARDGGLPRRPTLGLFTDVNAERHPVLHDVLACLRELEKEARRTSPFQALALAVEKLDLRAHLVQRGGNPDQALANVEQFLDKARLFAGRGREAFAEAMRRAWENDNTPEAAVAGTAGAVRLLSMHGSKGLEWPVVIPINSGTQLTAPRSESGVSLVHDRGQVAGRLFRFSSSDYDAVKDSDAAAARREGLRLWYVACTRAADLLAVPQFLPSDAARNNWASLVALAVPALPPDAELPRRHAEADTPPPPPDPLAQTEEVFRQQSEQLAMLSAPPKWLSPSRHRMAERSEVVADAPAAAEVDDAAVAAEAEPPLYGDRVQGVLVHKLFEDVLNGLVADDEAALAERARRQIAPLRSLLGDSDRLDAAAAARQVTATLALPQVAALRATLVPEVDVFAMITQGDAARPLAGVADAIAVDGDGRPTAVIDWKTGGRPTPATREKHRAQIRAYMSVLGIGCGMVVYVATGEVMEVTP